MSDQQTRLVKKRSLLKETEGFVVAQLLVQLGSVLGVHSDIPDTNDGRLCDIPLPTTQRKKTLCQSPEWLGIDL